LTILCSRVHPCRTFGDVIFFLTTRIKISHFLDSALHR
jgi:hypothetical protein